MVLSQEWFKAWEKFFCRKINPKLLPIYILDLIDNMNLPDFYLGVELSGYVLKIEDNTATITFVGLFREVVIHLVLDSTDGDELMLSVYVDGEEYYSTTLQRLCKKNTNTN